MDLDVTFSPCDVATVVIRPSEAYEKSYTYTCTDSVGNDVLRTNH